MPNISEIGAFARRHDPDRFLCALFAPAARREAIFALIGFNHELARAREAARTPIAALVRLQWWREVVEGAERRHEVATPLRAAITADAFDPEDLMAMIDAREIEAEEGGIADRAAFDAYLRGTAGGWAVAAARALGAAAAALPAVRAAGALYGLAGVLRSVPAMARQGRCLLPADRLAAHRIDWAASPTAVAPLVAELAMEGCAAAAATAVGLRALPRQAVAAALPFRLARRDLRRIAVGNAVPGRGFADRAAVALPGLLGRA